MAGTAECVYWGPMQNPETRPRRKYSEYLPIPKNLKLFNESVSFPNPRESSYLTLPNLREPPGRGGNYLDWEREHNHGPPSLPSCCQCSCRRSEGEERGFHFNEVWHLDYYIESGIPRPELKLSFIVTTGSVYYLRVM